MKRIIEVDGDLKTLKEFTTKIKEAVHLGQIKLGEFDLYNSYSSLLEGWNEKGYLHQTLKLIKSSGYFSINLLGTDLLPIQKICIISNDEMNDDTLLSLWQTIGNGFDDSLKFSIKIIK